MVTIILVCVIIVLGIFLMSSILHIKKIQDELVALGREQHTQNMDIIELIKHRQQTTEMLLQHIDILKYLVEQDPMLSRQKKWNMPVGEA